MRSLLSTAAAALSLSLASGALAADPPAKPAAPGAPAAAPVAAKPAARKGKKDDKPQGPVADMLGFEPIAAGGSRIYIELSGNATVTQHEAQGVVVFVLEGVQIKTSNTENSLELFHHNTPVVRAKLRRSKKDAELYIQLKSADVKPTQKLVEGKHGSFRLEIDFPAGNFVPGPDDAPPPAPPPPRKEKEKDKTKPGAKTAPAAPPAAPAAPPARR